MTISSINVCSTVCLADVIMCSAQHIMHLVVLSEVFIAGFTGMKNFVGIAYISTWHWPPVHKSRLGSPSDNDNHKDCKNSLDCMHTLRRTLAGKPVPDTTSFTGVPENQTLVAGLHVG